MEIIVVQPGERWNDNGVVNSCPFPIEIRYYSSDTIEILPIKTESTLDYHDTNDMGV